MNRLYARLAATNIKNNRQFYLPYLLTGTVAVAMFYLMTAMQDNPGLESLGSRATDIRIILSMGIVVVGVFVSIFLFYTNSFIMKRRKKELGVYNILGMEKKHIAKVLFLETVFSGAITMTGGLVFGIVFNKLLSMILYRMVAVDLNIPFYISDAGCMNTVKLFALIYAVTFLYNMMQIKLANPVELLHSSNTGEREPKTKILMTLIGVGTLGAGYYIALTTSNAVGAMNWFFCAVLLVIVGTYCLFTAGSIAVLKLLRRNKKFYYQTKHFTTVSGMLYRMKQNAVGLSNICILSTMVLITVSTTVSMYAGVEDSIKSRYPAEIYVAAYYNDVPKQEMQIAEMAKTSLKEAGRTITNEQAYMEASFAAMRNGNEIVCGATSDVADMTMAHLITKADYEALSGKTIGELKEGEIAVAMAPEIKESTVIFCGQEYVIKETCELPEYGEEAFSIVNGVCYLIVSDRTMLGEMFEILKNNWTNERVSPMISYVINLDIDGNAEEIDEAEAAMIQRMTDWENGSTEKEDAFSYTYIETRRQNRAFFYSLYGSLLFLGLFLGTLFLMVTVLIIFYKQISEGYEDKERFAIMEKVGMSSDEVKRAIRSQVLMVFFLPLVVAVLHVIMAFPMVRRLLQMMALVNIKLFVVCVAGTALVFGIIYLIVFMLTSRSYYKIVGNQV